MNYFSHPLKPEDITEENYRDVASNLLDLQMMSNIEQQVRALKYGWSDDDFDYLNSALDATKNLVDLAYDRSRDDLVHFLFGPRSTEPYDPTRPETLYDLYSAGGFCHALSLYIPKED